MDRNTVIGFVLIAAVLIGWSYFSSPSKEEIKAAQEKQDSIRDAKRVKDSLDLLARSQTKTKDTIIVADTVTDNEIVDKSGVFEPSVTGEEKIITVENDLLKLSLSNKGGKIYAVELKKYKTYYGKPLLLFKGDTNRFEMKFYNFKNDTINTSFFYFVPFSQNGNLLTDDSLVVPEGDSVSVSYRLYATSKVNDSVVINETSYIEYRYTLSSNTYLIDFKVNFVGMQDVVAKESPSVDFNFSNVALPQEKNIKNERDASTIYYKYLTDEVDYISERKDGRELLSNKIKWIGLKQQFFTSVVIADEHFINAELITKTNKDDSAYVKSLITTIGLPYEAKPSYSLDMSFYFGPNHFNTLRECNLELEKQIPLGWGIFGWINRFAVIPVFNFLNRFDINYGIIILILTLLIKLVLFPIAYKTYSSSAKMRILKPDIEEINKKFPKKEDALKKQQATMALYKKAGVNPMAGCLPMLLQLPILIAMFRFFPASIELRQEAFLWADDLSTYDSILNLPFNIPFYGDHVSLFTILMTITTIIYTKVNNDMMGSTNQMPGMKVMMYMMPVMFLGIFNNYSSALSYYYFLTNIITFAQMYVFRFIIDEDELKRKIEANKSKKVEIKKSGFQKRLEDMAKKRGYQPKK